MLRRAFGDALDENALETLRQAAQEISFACATNRRIEAYGHDRLMATAAQNQMLTAGALAGAIVDNIDQWIGRAEAFDDLALMAVEVSGNNEQSTRPNNVI